MKKLTKTEIEKIAEDKYPDGTHFHQELSIQRLAFKRGVLYAQERQTDWVSVEPYSEKLKRGDIFIWQSGMTGKVEIHVFHSDAGYGAKTFTGYNEKNGSSEIVNYSGIRGILLPSPPLTK